MRIQIALFSAPEIDPESIVVESEDGAVKVTGSSRPPTSRRGWNR